MKLGKIFKDYLIPIIIGILLVVIIEHFFFVIVRVDGTSMYPNLQNNERVMLLKQAKIKRNSVVVFNAQGVDKNNPTVTKSTKYIKRVIGLPGDKIRYTKSGKLYVNGKYQSQTYITKSQRTSGTLTLQLQEAKGVSIGTGKTFTVPKGKYFVLGDNRKASNDSRYYGFVPKNKINGVAKAFFWNKYHQLINSYK